MSSCTSPCAGVMGSENFITTSNIITIPDPPKHQHPQHQSLSAISSYSLHDLQLTTPSSPQFHSRRSYQMHKDPTILQQTKETFMQQVIHDRFRQHAKAFYEKTQTNSKCRPPAPPLSHAPPLAHAPPLSHAPPLAPPTIPAEFSFATRRRAVSRDRFADKSQENINSQKNNAQQNNNSQRNNYQRNNSRFSGIRSRSATPGNRTHKGRAHISPTNLDDKTNVSIFKRPLTEPEPFSLSCDTIHCKQDHETRIKQEIPLKSLAAHQSLTAPQDITLNTEARVAVWQQRRHMREEKEQIKLLIKKKEDEEREAMLRREAQKQATSIKATPMPSYPAPPPPAKSTRPLTQPVAPRLFSQQRVYRRNNSSTKLEDK